MAERDTFLNYVGGRWMAASTGGFRRAAIQLTRTM